MAVCRSIALVQEDLGGYRPMVERWTKPSRKRKPVISRTPLFPRVLILPHSQIHEAINHPHVGGIVRFGILPLLLDQRDLDRLREIEIEQKIQQVDIKNPSPPTYHIGQIVRVISGCFYDKTGLIDAVMAGGYYSVLLDGASISIEFDGCLLSAI